jgi:hypoxanthine phosphoribosyltransferase
LLSAAEIAAAVQALADRIAPRVADGTVAVALLTGALWFAADLTRALEARGRRLKFDALWMTSYGDQRVSGGRCVVRADLQRPVLGRAVLLIDDVFDSGLSLTEAARHVREAAEVLTAVFCRKPWPEPRPPEPDFVAWEAPARFLVGYGMDDAGNWRGLPYVGAMD